MGCWAATVEQKNPPLQFKPQDVAVTQGQMCSKPPESTTAKPSCVMAQSFLKSSVREAKQMSKKDEMSSRRESKRGECSNRKELLKSHGSEGDNFQKFQTDVSPMKIVKSSVKLPQQVGNRNETPVSACHSKEFPKKISKKVFPRSGQENMKIKLTRDGLCQPCQQQEVPEVGHCLGISPSDVHLQETRKNTLQRKPSARTQKQAHLIKRSKEMQDIVKLYGL